MHFQKPMLGVPLDWSNPLNKGLVMHLGFQEGHGDVVRDLSMNGNHGTLKNMAFPSTPASGWNPGQTGVGMNFDGTDDYVDCGDNASLDITDELSVFMWIKTSSTGTLISKESGYREPYIFGIIDNRLQFYGSNDGSAWDYDNIRSDTQFSNEWHYVGFSLDQINGLRFYLDGVRDGGSALTFTLKSHVAAKLTVGRRYSLTPAYFTGSIDQVRIHNRALTAKEVQDYHINPWSVYMDEEGM